MRRTILAAVAALAVLPALAFASAPPDTLPESYPAVGWQDATPEEVFELRRVVYGSGNLDSLKAVWATTQPESLPLNAWHDYSWLRVQLPTAIGRTVRDVQFFRQTGGAWWEIPHVEAIALYDGRLYRLQSLNKLLADVGFRFDTSEVPAVATVAVLWTLMERQAKLHQFAGDMSDHILRPGESPPKPDTAARATAIPAVTFRKIERREWRDARFNNLRRSAVVRVVATGKEMEFTIGMRPGTWQPEFAAYEGGIVNFYEVFRPKSQSTTPPAPQK